MISLSLDREIKTPPMQNLEPFKPLEETDDVEVRIEEPKSRSCLSTSVNCCAYCCLKACEVFINDGLNDGPIRGSCLPEDNPCINRIRSCMNGCLECLASLCCS